MDLENLAFELQDEYVMQAQFAKSEITDLNPTVYYIRQPAPSSSSLYLNIWSIT